MVHLCSAPSQGRLWQCRLGFKHDTLWLLPLPPMCRIVAHLANMDAKNVFKFVHLFIIYLFQGQLNEIFHRRQMLPNCLKRRATEVLETGSVGHEEDWTHCLSPAPMENFTAGPPTGMSIFLQLVVWLIQNAFLLNVKTILRVWPTLVNIV